MKTFGIILAAFAVAACTTAPPTAVDTKPVGSTMADLPPNADGIVARFTNDIWPAINAYTPDQAGSNRLGVVVDPSARENGWFELKDSIAALGGAGYDAGTQTTSYHDDLRVANTSVESVDGNNATLRACYTYTYYWYVNRPDLQHQPRASEAVVGLTKVANTWYLHSITNDHVVQGCPASPQA